MTHELVRHRLDVGYSQESQRYVNYNAKGACVIMPQIDPVKYPSLCVSEDFHQIGQLMNSSEAWSTVQSAYIDAIRHYNHLIKLGLPPESARCVLPNGTATKIGVTWLRHSGFVNLAFWRLEKHAQYPIRRMLSKLVVEATKMHHPFLMSLRPELVAEWLGEIQVTTPGVAQDEEFKALSDEMNKRAEHIKELIKKRKAQLEAAAKAQEEAQMKRIEAEMAERKAAMAAAAAKAEIENTAVQTSAAPEQPSAEQPPSAPAEAEPVGDAPDAPPAGEAPVETAQQE